MRIAKEPLLEFTAFSFMSASACKPLDPSTTAELTARPLVILVVGDCFHLPLQAKCIELVQG